MRRRGNTVAIWILGASLVVSACGGGEPAGDGAPAPVVESTGGLRIGFQSRPDPPEIGDNTFEVTVHQPDGSPVTDATVVTEFTMSAMPAMNMPAMRSTATLTHTDAGRYGGTAPLSMAGTWNVAVTVSRGGEDVGRAGLSVIAR